MAPEGLKAAQSELATLKQKAGRVLRAQLVVSVVLAGLFLLQGVTEALSALYGGLASLIIAWFLSRGVRRASELATVDIKKSMATLYVGAVQRFLLVIGLLALGLSLLKLNPIALCVGFAVTQMSYLVSSRQ
jgi:ATP synthase protein I